MGGDSGAREPRAGRPDTEDENVTIEIRCPTCKVKIAIAKREADRTMVARCPNGHEIPLVKAIE